MGACVLASVAPGAAIGRRTEDGSDVGCEVSLTRSSRCLRLVLDGSVVLRRSTDQLSVPCAPVSGHGPDGSVCLAYEGTEHALRLRGRNCRGGIGGAFGLSGRWI